MTAPTLLVTDFAIHRLACARQTLVSNPAAPPLVHQIAKNALCGYHAVALARVEASSGRMESQEVTHDRASSANC